jgi:phage terminase small subunit
MAPRKTKSPAPPKAKRRTVAASEGVAPAEVSGDTGKMTIKQELFCQAYITSGNASEAYRKAYDAEAMKPESVNRVAHELLKNLKIASRLEELREDILARHQVTIDRVIGEYAKLAFTNMQDFMRVDADGLPCLDLSKLTRHQSAAISEVTCEVVRTETVAGDISVPVLKAKIKLADKRGALDSLSKVLGIFVEKHELTGKDGAPIIPLINVTTTGGA